MRFMSYDRSAKYYDLFGEKDDSAYYKELGMQYGSALEIGVGTARVALELAAAGVDVWGIDNSQKMLEIARATCAEQPADIKNRIVLTCADMTDFHLSTQFPLVYMASSVFSHCITQEDQLDCLTCVLNHLEEGGLFVLDLHLPEPSYTTALRLIDKEEVDDTVVVRWISNRAEYADQLLHTTLIFEAYTNGVLTERIIESSTVSLIYKRELLLLLDKAGFTIEHIYGNYSKSEKIDNLVVVEARPKAF
jgi:SAM-dependent methyltransferase